MIVRGTITTMNSGVEMRMTMSVAATWNRRRGIKLDLQLFFPTFRLPEKYHVSYVRRIGDTISLFDEIAIGENYYLRHAPDKVAEVHGQLRVDRVDVLKTFLSLCCLTIRFARTIIDEGEVNTSAMKNNRLVKHNRSGLKTAGSVSPCCIGSESAQAASCRRRTLATCNTRFLISKAQSFIYSLFKHSFEEAKLPYLRRLCINGVCSLLDAFRPVYTRNMRDVKKQMSGTRSVFMMSRVAAYSRGTVFLGLQ